MKKTFLKFGIAFCLTLSWKAQGEEGPFFWKAEKEGQVSYILGTLHILDFKSLQCSDEVLNHLESAELLFTEWDFFQKRPSDLVSKKRDNKEEQSRDKEISEQNFPEETRKYKPSPLKEVSNFNNLSLPYQEFFKDKIPALQSEGFYLPKKKHPEELNYQGLASLLGQICAFENRGALQIATAQNPLIKKVRPVEKSMDAQVEEMALKNDIDYVSLDESSLSVQLNQLRSQFEIPISAEDIEKMIENYSQNCSEHIKTLTQMISWQTWIIAQFQSGQLKHDDILFLLKLGQNTKEGFEVFSVVSPSEKEKLFQSLWQVLLLDRNEIWLEKIVQAGKDYESFFVAAGVAHFIVPEASVLEGLREEGFSIQRMGKDCRF